MVLGKYVDPQQLMVAGGPLAAVTVARVIAGKSKLMGIALKGSAAWFAVKELSTPVNHLLNDQFGYLQSVFGMFRN